MAAEYSATSKPCPEMRGAGRKEGEDGSIQDLNAFKKCETE
jgi:hypothetical protein